MSDLDCIYNVFDLALAEDRPDIALEEILQEGLLDFFPSVKAMVGFGGGDSGHKDLWSHTKQVVLQTIPKHPLRWAALFHDVGKVKCFSTRTGKVSFHHHEEVSANLFMADVKNIGMPDQVRDKVRFLVANLGLVEGYDVEWTDSAVRRLSKEVGEHFDDLVSLSRADITTKHDYLRRQHHSRIHEMVERVRKLAEEDSIPPALPSGLGDALKVRFNLVEGVELGKIMKKLKEEVEAGKLPRNAEFQTYIHALGSDP